jgi:AraC-like DNA-binding protein
MRQIKNIIDLLKDTATEVYALSDNHSADQGRLNDIRNRLGDNYTELQRNFEDSFDMEILIKALQAILQEENHPLNDPEIATIRTDLSSSSSAFKVLGDKYQQKIKPPNKLSKVRLGEHIADMLKGSQYLEKSEPEKLIRKIHDRVIQQMNLEL